ncbi:TRM11 family SAM-dependent methyltransferase [Patescibacteria group bacterium]
MQQYAFIFGHRPLLSLAELEALCANQGMIWQPTRYGNGVLVAEFAKAIESPQDFLNQLGGTVKIAEIKAEEPATLTTFRKHLQRELTASSLLNNYFTQSQKKVLYGFSLYSLASNLSSKDLQIFLRTYGIDLKVGLRELGVSSRLVVGQKSILSSVIVTKNRLLERGAEIDIIFDQQYLAIAKTIAVQDFQAYRRRDYGRPQADPKKGMMPPKLAQILLNLARLKTDNIILDPFCGVGTILQEGLLKDLRVIGTDVDRKAIEQAKENLAWLASEYQLNPQKIIGLEATDVKYLEEHVKPASVNAVATESTLGPAISLSPTRTIAKRNLQRIEKTISEALKAIHPLLVKQGKVVITLPYYILPKNRLFLPIIDNFNQLGYTQVEPLGKKIREKCSVTATKRGSLLYERPRQVVGREVVILRKK